MSDRQIKEREMLAGTESKPVSWNLGQNWKGPSSDCPTTKIDKFKLFPPSYYLFQQVSNKFVVRMGQYIALWAENVERSIKSRKTVKMDECPTIYVTV
jgi:hypothetical protein